MFYIIKKKKYIPPMFQNITQIVKKQVILLMIPNREGWLFFKEGSLFSYTFLCDLS